MTIHNWSKSGYNIYKFVTLWLPPPLQYQWMVEYQKNKTNDSCFGIVFSQTRQHLQQHIAINTWCKESKAIDMERGVARGGHSKVLPVSPAGSPMLPGPSMLSPDLLRLRPWWDLVRIRKNVSVSYTLLYSLMWLDLYCKSCSFYTLQ